MATPSNHPSPRRWIPIAACTVLLVGLLLPGGSGSIWATEGPAPQGQSWVGLSLGEALRELQARGLSIVFSSRVVQPGLRVAAEPGATTPRQILDEILAPHGLRAQEGARGSLIILRSPPAPRRHSGILGTIVSRHNGAPIRGVRVHVPEAAATVTTGLEGVFQIPALAPGRYTVEADAPGFLPERLPGIVVTAEETTRVSLTLQPTPVTLDEIVVTPRLTLLQDVPEAPLALSRQDILSLPHLGDDVFRALSLLPGIAANDVTAQFHIRGGRRDEVQILLDGQELYDAYHLKDFDSALSIVDQTALAGVDLRTGGFPVQYGDRMGGVLDMRTADVQATRHQLGLNLLAVQGGSAGTFHDRRGSWLALARRGSADLLGKVLKDENPAYWDVLAKGEHRFGTHHRLRANLLHSEDRWDLQETTDDGSKNFDTAYDRSYLWLTHETLVGRRSLVESAISWSRIERARRGIEQEEEQRFALADDRGLIVTGVRQHWDLQASPSASWKGGFEIRHFDADFDYFRTVEFDTPVAAVREVVDSVDFVDRFTAEHRGAYLSHRRRLLPSLTVEAGWRYDRHTLTEETLWSPRLNLVHALGKASILRAAWGVFHQSHRPYELPVEDGALRFAPAERSEHFLLGFERAFGRLAGGSGTPRWNLRLEVYRRDIENPRNRFENLYEPINQFPEIEPDRFQIIPQRSTAEGIEVFLRGALTRRLDFWLTYTYAVVEDEVESEEDVRRGIDQPQSLNAILRTQWGKWHLNLAWRFRTGWPTTPLALEEVADPETGEVEFVPVLGALNSQRLPNHHRLDLRLSRPWSLRSGTLLFFVEIQNLYNRANVAGFDFQVDEDEGTLTTHRETWPGIFPSLGIRWEF